MVNCSIFQYYYSWLKNFFNNKKKEKKMNAKFLKSVILIVVIAITSTASTFAEIKIRQQLDMQGNYITNLANPTKLEHAVPKEYVDWMLDISIAKLPKPGNQPGEIGLTWPNPRFIDNGDGTVTDNLTDLMWTTNGNSRAGCNWNTAIDWCRAYVYAGYSDWRLPNINELSSLGNYSQANVATWLNSSATPFSGVLASRYWASTSFSAYTGSAWFFHMNPSTTMYVTKNNYCNVWPIRAGR